MVDVDPYAPPQTEVEATPEGFQQDLAFPAEAVDEMKRAAPWVRWAFRLGLLSAILGFVNALVSAEPKGTEGISVFTVLLITTPLYAISFVVIKRYADSLSALLANEEGGLLRAVTGQRNVYRLSAFLCIAAVSIAVLAIVVALIISVSQAGGAS